MTAQPGATAPSPRHTAERVPIASYDGYSEAERAVDHLSDQGFPVQRTAIIGRDVQLVEQVIGRVGLGSAMLRGAGSGALAGLLIGWLFGLFNWFVPVLATLMLALYGLVFGAVIGAIFGLVVHALQRGGRDFASVRAMVPTRYEVVADAEVADEARELLAKLPTTAGGA
jgi:hypothetical protein